MIHQKNKGVSAARNSGLKIASGNYIGFVDSDDWIEPEMYNSLMNAILDTESEVAVCSFKESNKPIKPKDNYEVTNKIFNKKDFLYYCLDNGFYVWRNLYSRNIISNIKFNENIPFTEDTIFGVDIIQFVNKVVFINKAYYNYFFENFSSLTKRKYNEKVFSTVDSNLYLQSKVSKLFPNDHALKDKIRKMVLDNAMFHYIKLHENKAVLYKNSEFRTKVKSLIKYNFKWSDELTLILICSRFLGDYPFKIFYSIYATLKICQLEIFNYTNQIKV